MIRSNTIAHYHCVLVICVAMCYGCSALSSGANSFIAEKCLMKYEESYRRQKYSDAAKYLLKYIDSTTRAGDQQTAYYDDLAELYRILGKYDMAIQAKQKTYELWSCQDRIIEWYREKGLILLNKGDYRLAGESYLSGLAKAIEYDKKDNKAHKMNYALHEYRYLSGYYCEIGDYDKALGYMEMYLEYYKKYNARAKKTIDGKDQAEIGIIKYFQGQYKDAENILAHVLETERNYYASFLGENQRLFITLGLLAEYRNAWTEALRNYQEALSMIEKGTGGTNPESFRKKMNEAIVWDYIGRLCLKMNDPTKAFLAYTKASAMHQETQTEGNPGNAVGVRGLADVSVYNGDLVSAIVKAKESLKILDTALVPTHPRIAPTLIALSSIYELTGKPDQAVPLKERIETILQKPLGPWKEDFMETAAFYTEQLKKANKPTAAKYLEQLQARQKDKR